MIITFSLVIITPVTEDYETYGNVFSHIFEEWILCGALERPSWAYLQLVYQFVSNTTN